MALEWSSAEASAATLRPAVVGGVVSAGKMVLQVVRPFLLTGGELGAVMGRTTWLTVSAGFTPVALQI